MSYCVHEEGKIDRKSKGFKIQFQNEIILQEHKESRFKMF
jgi:hypothetical protein